MAVEPNDDTVVLWKTSNIDLGNDRFMFVIYYYHAVKGDHTKSFYKCNIRIDTKDGWKRIRDSLLEKTPAEYFRTSMIGLDDDYRMYYSRHTFNKADMYKWIGSKFSPKKTTTLDVFVKEELDPSKSEPFLRKYNVDGQEIDLTETDKIPNGRWFSTFKEKKPRKKYGNIIK